MSASAHRRRLSCWWCDGARRARRQLSFGALAGSERMYFIAGRWRTRTKAWTVGALSGVGGGVALLPGAAGGAGRSRFGAFTPNQKVRPMDAAPATTKSVALKAAKNEFEAFQIVMTAPGGRDQGVLGASSRSRSSAPAAPRFRPQTSSSTARLITTSARPRTTRARRGYGRIRSSPTSIRTSARSATRSLFDVPAGETRVVWVDILVPGGRGRRRATRRRSRSTSEVRRAASSRSRSTSRAFSLPSTASLATAVRNGMGRHVPRPHRILLRVRAPRRLVHGTK